MAPYPGSRHSFTLGVRDEEGRLFLTEREPYLFHEHTDTRVHVVAQGDTLFELAGRYFAPLPRACGFWWVLADFQINPIVEGSGTLCDSSIRRFKVPGDPTSDSPMAMRRSAASARSRAANGGGAPRFGPGFIRRTQSVRCHRCAHYQSEMHVATSAGGPRATARGR